MFAEMLVFAFMLFILMTVAEKWIRKYLGLDQAPMWPVWKVNHVNNWHKPAYGLMIFIMTLVTIGVQIPPGMFYIILFSFIAAQTAVTLILNRIFGKGRQEMLASVAVSAAVMVILAAAILLELPPALFDT